MSDALSGLPLLEAAWDQLVDDARREDITVEPVLVESGVAARRLNREPTPRLVELVSRAGTGVTLHRFRTYGGVV